MLQLGGITKSFGGRIALHGLTMAVEPGSLAGFVGGNGAGARHDLSSSSSRTVRGCPAAAHPCGTATRSPPACGACPR